LVAQTLQKLKARNTQVKSTKMDKKLSLSVIILFDILVSIPFIGTNWWIWQYLSGKITANAWGPFK